MIEKPIWLSLLCGGCTAIGAFSKPFFDWLKSKRRSKIQTQSRVIQLDHDQKIRESMMREIMFKEIQLEIQYLRERCGKLEAMVELERSIKHGLANELNPMKLNLSLSQAELQDSQDLVESLNQKVERLEQTIREKDQAMRELHEEIVILRRERDEAKRR